MGLIKAALGAVGGTISDQWLEYFYCDAMPMNVMAVKAKKRTSGRSGNTGSDNIISKGSVIAVADNQCMLIVEQGRVVEVCAEPGEFRFDNSTEPSLFTGPLGEGIKKTFETIGKRFTFGGEPPKDQRVYYINTRELMDNKFGTPTPIPFHIANHRTGFEMEANLRCNGTYSYKIVDPLLFYTNVCVNFSGSEFTRDSIEGQLKTEFISNLGMALAPLSATGVMPSQIPAHTREIVDEMNRALSSEWRELRGLQLVKIALMPPTLPPDEMKQMQMVMDPRMGNAALINAGADAMRTAAGNAGGAMVGFAGMNMAMGAGGGMMGAAINGLQQAQPQQNYQQPAPPAGDSWRCSCGAMAAGKFCTECGKPKPQANGWTCSCGAVNQGKFCPQCGKPKPAGAPLYKCDKCGWTPPDPKNPPKFCPQCGDAFDENDIAG